MKPIHELIELRDKSAIVTGGAMGIGLGIARRLGEAGASVVIADIDEESALESAKTLEADGLRAIGLRTDVSDEADVHAAIHAANTAFGSLDILVNNAGIYPNVPLESLEPELFDRVIAVNLTGVYLFTKYAAEQMKLQGRGGNIVNVTSIDALHPSMVGLASYDATKHACWGFTKNVALELAPFGIAVNAVAPGGIATPGVAALNQTPEGSDVEALIERFLAKIPMGRMGDPDEIGKVVLFLVSDMASYMTGSQVVVDGGALLA